MSGSAHDNELTAFQAALARLQPAPDEINLARLLFQAGRLSAPRSNWVWPCAAAASLMLAVALGSALLLRPAPEPAERIVQVFVPSPQPESQPEPPVPSNGDIQDTQPPAGQGDYLQLRRAVLANGLDVLPPPMPWSAATSSDDTDTLLDLPRGSREPWLLRLKRSLKSGDAS